MKLEAIDPLNLSAICVATIRKVRKQTCVWGDGQESVFHLPLFRFETKKK